MKKIYNKLNYLESWLIDRGYRGEVVRPEIQKVNSIDCSVVLEKDPKHLEGSVTLILTFHQVLHVIFGILKSAYHHIDFPFQKIVTYVTFYIPPTNLGAQLQGKNINFYFNCNSDCVVYLLTCKVCAKQ